MMKTAIVILLGAVGVWCLWLYLATPAAESKHAARPAHNTTPPSQISDRHLSPTGNDSRVATASTATALARSDIDCTVELNEYVTPSGETFSAYTCSGTRPESSHPYAHYDNDSLAILSYDDAAAAALLGQRLIRANTERSYDLLLRAAALDGGDFRHLAWLSDQAFGVISVDGVPQLENLMRQYELAALAAQLGDTSERATYLRAELLRLGLGNDELAVLDARVTTLLLAMRDIQQTVQGEVTIGGVSDA